MTRKTLGVVAAVGLLAVAVAAPTAAQAPDDPLGVVTIPPGEPIVIAGWGVNTGPNASLGTDWMNSMNVKADELGGEFLGHPLEFIFEDAGCSPETGATAAQALAANSQLVGLIGTACSGETAGGIAAVTNAGLTTISPSATRADLTAEDRPADYAGFLRTAHNDLDMGAYAAQYIFNDLGLTKAATIHDGSPYAQGLVEVFETDFPALGGEIVASEAIQVGQTDMRPVLTSIAAAAPEVIFFPIYTGEAGYLVAQSAEVAGLENTVLVGADGMFSPDFIKGAGPAAVDMYLLSAAVAGDEYQAFLAKYEEVNGTPPPQAYHAHGYDAINILLQKIEQVAVPADDGTLYVPKGALRDAIYATADYDGLSGNITCRPNGDCGAGAIGAFQVNQETVDGAWPPPIVQVAGE
jgi:branched-chain amino acid transport system substrate-binding protein